jgi:transposase
MKENKIKEHPRNYHTECKQQVLHMISNGRPVREVAESLGIGENLIYRWRSRQQTQGTAGKENSALTIDQQTLLGRIRELETEHDICTCRRASASGPKKH